MQMTEQDLELLEAYLDGELSEEESARLRERVSASPELAGGLEMLRGQRATRVQAWRSFEPSALEVDRLTDRLERTIGQQPVNPVWDRALSFGRIVTAAAACLVMGIAIGRIGGGTAGPITPAGGGQVAGPRPGSTLAPAEQPATVFLTDDTGRVFVQQFRSAREAQRFIEDFERARQEQLRRAGEVPHQAPEQF